MRESGSFLGRWSTWDGEELDESACSNKLRAVGTDGDARGVVFADFEGELRAAVVERARDEAAVNSGGEDAGAGCVDSAGSDGTGGRGVAHVRLAIALPLFALPTRRLDGAAAAGGSSGGAQAWYRIFGLLERTHSIANHPE